MHIAHTPLLDIRRMWIRQIKQSLGKMSYYRTFVQKLLIIELLRKHLLTAGTPDNCRLIRKHKLFLLDQLASLHKKSCLLDLL